MNTNLSDQEFFNCYVKKENWQPLQNHGLVDEDVKLQKEDLDFPYQITSYLNLFKNDKIKNKKILDIGCGYGRGTYIIKKYLPDNEVTGIDINQSFIDYAKNIYKNVNYLQDDFNNTKLKPSTFDYIISNCSMHFFYNKDTTYENFNNILKDDGRIIITDIWADETLDYFFKKIKEYNFKIEKQEDLSNKTIDSMNGDISKILMSHSKNVKDESINAFLTVQKNRLKLFYNNTNKQIKFILMKGKKDVV